MTGSAGEEAAGQGDSVTGWKLDSAQRMELLQQFPPRYANVVADHVTLRTGVGAEAPLPVEDLGEMIGRADDGAGVEAMVVAIGGTSARPGGGTYHITWSLAPGRQARESNDVIAAYGWADFDLPMPVALEPALWTKVGA
jgi:hypothetical protein